MTPAALSNSSRRMLRAAALAMLLIGVGVAESAEAAAPSEDAGSQVDATPEAPQPSGPDEGDATGGPSLGIIIAGCFGVLFGGLIARWQIKALQARNNR